MDSVYQTMTDLELFLIDNFDLMEFLHSFRVPITIGLILIMIPFLYHRIITRTPGNISDHEQINESFHTSATTTTTVNAIDNGNTTPSPSPAPAPTQTSPARDDFIGGNSKSLNNCKKCKNYRKEKKNSDAAWSDELIKKKEQISNLKSQLDQTVTRLNEIISINATDRQRLIAELYVEHQTRVSMENDSIFLRGQWNHVISTLTEQNAILRARLEDALADAKFWKGGAVMPESDETARSFEGNQK